jgi:hypothetical protein
MIPGDRLHGRALQLFRDAPRVAEERLLDHDGGQCGKDGDQLRFRIVPLHDGHGRLVEDAGAGGEDDQRDQDRGDALRLAVPIGMIVVKGFAPDLQSDNAGEDRHKVGGALQPVGEDRLGMAEMAGQQLHDHQDRVDPEAGGDHPVGHAEPFVSIHRF